MDVRCERCQTEYELEDGSVSEAGTQVQCTTCGHTFLVRRTTVGMPPVPTHGYGSSPPSSRHAAQEAVPPPDHSGPAAAEWLLETADGQFHRFRNLTSLQKWIIERKVTRDDRISRTGHAWRHLGEIVELAPFFNVIDEADRARSMHVASLKGEAEMARQMGRSTPGNLAAIGTGSRSEASQRGAPALEAGSLQTSLRRGSPMSDAGLSGSDLGSMGGGEMATSIVRVRSGYGGKLLAGAAVGVVVAFLGLQWLKAARAPAGPVQVIAPAPAVVPVAQVAPSAHIAPTPVPVAAAPVAVPLPTAAAPEAAAPAPTGDAKNAPAVPASAASDEGKSYDRLVAEGDRAIENGSTARAEKLYDRALKMKPAGFEALSGLGYVALDKGRTAQAIAYFRKSSALQPHPPAVFGLAEAFRTQGDSDQALDNYRKYLAIAPGGTDANAAQRQVKALEARQGAGSGPTATSAPPPAATAPAPPAVEAPPPPKAALPTPSSVLSEPAKPSQ